MANGFEISGMQQVQEAFRVLGDQAARRVVKSAATAGAAQIRAAVRQAAPVSTVKRKTVYAGHKYDYLRKHLRQQITTKFVKSFESDVKILIHTGDAFWGRFTEKGTKKGIKAQHWMEKAFDAAEEQVKYGMEKKLVDAIMREAGKGGR